MPFNITSTGGSGDGAPGPRGPQGEPGNDGLNGAGFDPQPLVKSNLDPTIGSSMTLIGPDNPFTGAWSVGSYVRVINSVNTEEFFEGTITDFTSGGLTVTILISYVTETWTREGSTDVWTMTLAGQRGADGSGTSANIADFVFTNVDETNSSITVTGNKELTIQSGSSEDLNVHAGDDLWLTSDDNISVQAGDELNLRSHDSTSIITNYVDLENAEHEWLFGSQGYLTLPGGAQIVSQPNSSGDGSGFSTLELVPDGGLETDQYIMIDPTGPNHIHVRAGGTPDDSSADLFLGAELNNVQVSDQSREVTVRTRGEDTTYTALNVNYSSGESFVLSMATEIAEGDSVIVNDISYPIANLVLNSPTEGLQTLTVTGVTFTSNETYTFVRISNNSNSWDFRSDGTLVGPSLGLTVLGLLNSGDDDLGLYANDADIILQAASGKVDIIAPEVNIVSNVVPSSFNINTYLGATVNSNRTSTYAAEDKVVATLGDINAINTGDITFDGVQITGAGTASGDGSGNGTIELIPDGDLLTQQYHENQYLIIDPTSPNHIHIRAGGVQDASTADLFLGAERTGVQVSDGSGNVIIRSKNPDRVDIYANSNQASNTEFMVATGANILVGDTVHLYAGGDNFVVTAVTQEYPYAGLMTVVADGLSFVTGESYTFSRNMGEDRWLFDENGITFPNNTVQTDAFEGGATGTFETPDSKLVTVTNGIITSIEPLI